MGAKMEPKVSNTTFGRFFEGRCLGHFWKGAREAGAFRGKLRQQISGSQGENP